MLQNELANILLYVPFNQEYPATAQIQETLTLEEFYATGGCYYNPEFDKEIQNINTLTDEQLADLEYPLSRETVINMLEEQRDAEKSLVSWIKSSGTGVYCIAGDAGTGKSTFLHHLEYEHPEFEWEFIDIQRSVETIKIMDQEFSFNRFSTLRDKVLSSIIYQMVDSLFVKNTDHIYDYKKTKRNIREWLSFFQKYCSKYHPNSKIRELYEELNNIHELSRLKYCTQCAKVFRDYYASLCNSGRQKIVFKSVVEQYFIFLLYHDLKKKHIIVFDNLERYIGTDEIFNDQIIEFFRQLRLIRDNYSRQADRNNEQTTNFAKHFQFIVAMRKTSVRMFTPQQNADFIAHKIDLSDWFAIDKIIEKKIRWYERHVELLEDKYDPILFSHLQYILADQGRTGNVLRGLRLKLNLLFNNDKRLIVDFLISTLKTSNNNNYLRIANTYNERTDISESLRKFAYRSIIWRIVFNKLRTSEWLQHILSFGDKELITAELDYARKILTILSNYALERPQAYISLYELLSTLYPQIHNIKKWFWDKNTATERSKLAKVLYSMNYYDRRENNWFQFIDIQCNSQAINEKHLSDALVFEESVFQPNVAKEMRIQITTSGKAYLGYVVQTFEFISCIYNELPPLLCAVPTPHELRQCDVESLECVKIAECVAEQSAVLQQNVMEDIRNGFTVRYQKERGSAHALSYAERVKNSHRGYLNNFCEFFDVYVVIDDPELREKKKAAIDKLMSIGDKY